MEQNSGEKERPSCMSQNLGTLWNKISVKKERPSCMSLNFGTLWNKILMKKKDPTVHPGILYSVEQNSGEKKDPPGCP